MCHLPELHLLFSPQSPARTGAPAGAPPAGYRFLRHGETVRPSDALYYRGLAPYEIIPLDPKSGHLGHRVKIQDHLDSDYLLPFIRPLAPGETAPPAAPAPAATAAACPDAAAWPGAADFPDFPDAPARPPAATPNAKPQTPNSSASAPARQPQPGVYPGDGYRFLAEGETLRADDETIAGYGATAWALGAEYAGKRVGPPHATLHPEGWYRRRLLPAGEGYRLLGEDEAAEEGDEYVNPPMGATEWKVSPCEGLNPTVAQRRRNFLAGAFPNRAAAFAFQMRRPLPPMAKPAPFAPAQRLQFAALPGGKGVYAVTSARGDAVLIVAQAPGHAPQRLALSGPAAHALELLLRRHRQGGNFLAARNVIQHAPDHVEIEA